MRVLTADELARACGMRDDKWPWSKIGAALHIATPTIRDALIAEGYPPAFPASRGVRWSESKRRRAYELYVYERLSFAEIARRLDAPDVTVGRVVRRELKRVEQQPYQTSYRKPKVRTVCVIGNTHGGSTFCAQRWCEQSACGQYVTHANLTAFHAFQARRREAENNDEARRTVEKGER